MKIFCSRLPLSRFPLSRLSLVLAGTALLPFVSFGQRAALASDHTNLETGLPTQIEDAYPAEFGNREFQLQGRYQRTGNGRNQYILDPAVEVGFARNWQGRISLPFQLGGGDRTGSGDVGLEAFYNFNNESLHCPAFALSAHADLPTGRNSSGIDTQFKFIATKSLGKSRNLQRVHLNLSYFNNAGAGSNERSNRYSGIVGYSQRLNADTVGIVDYVHEQDRERDVTNRLIEVGLRRQVTPLMTLSLGVGAGVGHDSPDFRVTAGLQKSF